MPEIKWKIKNIRDQIAVIDGKVAPSIVLTNATYLHTMFKDWRQGNIWILGDRVVYVGEAMPANLEGTEVVDMTGKKLVPGYIEPHVHPYQLYNPATFAKFAAQTGTTTFLSDNMSLVFLTENEKAFTLLRELSNYPFSFYWWSRFDSQTEIDYEDELFSNQRVLEWLDHPDVLLGGELTGWPKLLHGDDQMLYWIQAAKQKGKKIEGHFPGASERTLAKMKLFGADGDHEAMTVDEVENRILHGIKVTLRNSSIRPDLSNLLKGIVERKLNIFDHLMMTTDGATPAFYEKGIVDECIRIALDAGVSPIDAYQMASYNVARYYNIATLHGMIATGRYASINILEDELNPTPVSVLSKGIRVKRDGVDLQQFDRFDWSALGELDLSFDLTEDDFQFSMPIGLELVNDVITKPFTTNLFPLKDELPKNGDISYLMLVDRKGKWRVNTLIKGFDQNVRGFASSYSSTGDIILIGKCMADMRFALQKLKEMKGGIVLVEDGQVVADIPLTIAGVMYDGDVEQLIEKEKALKKAIRERGYKHSDVIYTLLFLQSTHLPYIRITPRGLYDVLKAKVLLPSVMR
ncbi:MAG: adenine deaminase C-terminal domain-containing protein [Lysinibacillus sp.]